VEQTERDKSQGAPWERWVVWEL